MDSLPDGFLGLDAGTGNGKYLPLPLDRHGGVRTIGLDRSRNLLMYARNAGGKSEGDSRNEVVVGDVLDQVWRPGVFVGVFYSCFDHFIDVFIRTLPFR